MKSFWNQEELAQGLSAPSKNTTTFQSRQRQGLDNILKHNMVYLIKCIAPTEKQVLIGLDAAKRALCAAIE